MHDRLQSAKSGRRLSATTRLIPVEINEKLLELLAQYEFSRVSREGNR